MIKNLIMNIDILSWLLFDKTSYSLYLHYVHTGVLPKYAHELVLREKG